MKKLNLEQMESISGGRHTLGQHIVCVAIGVLAESLGPLAVVTAMLACYASFDNA
jgi:lactobin A/cerein 7B family class IIb bacteriocin